jgi:hypothetical protein
MLSQHELRGKLRTTEPAEFCRDILFADETWLFEDRARTVVGTYDEFRATVARTLGIGNADVALVGSSKLGFSLNPKVRPLLGRYRRAEIRDRKPSDLDLIIVKPGLFNECWESLLAAYYLGFWRAEYHRDEVFRRFVSLRDDARYPVRHLMEVIASMGQLKRDLQTTFRITTAINYRIYASMDDAIKYHEYGIGALKKALAHD